MPMPTRFTRNARARTLAALLASALSTLAFSALTTSAFAASPAPPAPSALEADKSAAEKTTVENSKLDAPLFYQLLIGELQLNSGELGTACQVVLDAAKRTKDEQLFLHATQIALQGRAGDQALASVKAWRQALPDSLDAMRYEV